MAGKFDWKKTAKKTAYAALAVALAGLAAQYGDSNWYLALAPLLLGLKNLVQHWND